MENLKNILSTLHKLDWLLIIIISLFTVGHFIVAVSQPFMGDEILSLFFANSYSFSELIYHQLELVHPNTYYLLVKLLWSIGLSATGLRLVSFIVFLSSMLLWYFLARTLSFKLTDRLIFTLLYVTSPYLLRFSFLVRMYSIGFIISILSIIFCIKWLQTLKSKYFISSIFTDILGILFVFGYILLPLTKLVTFLIHRRSLSKLQKQLPKAYLFWLGCILIPAWLYYSKSDVLLQKFLWWVPATKLIDSILALPPLLGLAGFGYFEGHTPLSGILVIMGMVTAIGSVIAAIVFRKITNNSVTSKFNQLQFWMLHLSCSGIIVYLTIFAVAYLTGWRIFHIRQLFITAIFFLWLIGFSLVILRRKYTILFSASLGIILAFFIRAWFSSYLPPASAYPQYYMSATNKPVVFSASDVELAFDQCQAFSYQEMISKCVPLEYYLVQNGQELTMLLIKLQRPITATTIVYLQSIREKIDWLECHQISPEFYNCTIDYEFLINQS